MSITSSYNLSAVLTGDAYYSQRFYSDASIVSPGKLESIDLVSGNNTITVPSGAVAVVIIPPTDNIETLTLKGVNGDTGIALHLTNPFILSLASVSTFVINAGGIVTGLRLIYL